MKNSKTGNQQTGQSQGHLVVKLLDQNKNWQQQLYHFGRFYLHYVTHYLQDKYIYYSIIQLYIYMI